MRWPWQRPKADVAEAQEHIDKLKRQQPEVTRLSRELQAARKQNHFSEMIVAALRGAP
jgi:hypothetical protein